MRLHLQYLEVMHRLVFAKLSPSIALISQLMEPITLEAISKAVANLVYKDIAVLQREIASIKEENREHMMSLFTKVNTLLDNRTAVVPILGKFLQLL